MRKYFLKIVVFLFVYIISDIIFEFKFVIMAKKEYTVIEIALLATAFGKDPQTIKRWIMQNDDRLTSDKAKAALLSKPVKK